MADFKKYRYPGVQPFRTSEQHIFFGRDEDKDKLYNLISLEKLIILFGKSGYGKSSLLSAGIIPMLTDAKKRLQFTPLEIRLGTYIPQTARPPLQTLLQRLDEKLSDTEGGKFLKQEPDKDSLWYRFKQKQTDDIQRIVLIFDQFEEFFSYPIAWQNEFRWQLADLLFTDMPEKLRDSFDQRDDDEQFFLSNPMNIKVVFSIRADRMSYLDSMKDALPTILHKRYELRSLTPVQARDAIVKPASIRNDEFDSPPFEYTEGGLAAMIKALTTTDSKDHTATGIEAFQLQIVCEYIENLVKEGKVPDINNNGLPDITEAQLPEMASLYQNYYRRKLSELDPSVTKAAQRVLEDGLLAEDAATGEGRRMSVDSRALLGQFSKMGLTEKVLIDLEKTYLIRREVNTVGGFSFEISHDTLVAPIQKAKAERKAIEEKERIEREQIEREQQLAEAKRQAEIEEQKRKEAERLRQEADEQRQIAIKERENADIQTQKAKKQQRRSNIFATLAFVGLIGAVVLAVFANRETKKAEEALSKFKIEEQMRKQLDARQLIERAKSMRDAGYLTNALEDLDAALKLDSTEQTRKEIENLRKTIK